MKWSDICSKLGIPIDVSIGTEPPENAMVFDADVLEELMRISYDELNTAFCNLEDWDTEDEFKLDEDYDW
jgi:hypothetical protein